MRSPIAPHPHNNGQTTIVKTLFLFSRTKHLLATKKTETRKNPRDFFETASKRVVYCIKMILILLTKFQLLNDILISAFAF